MSTEQNINHSECEKKKKKKSEHHPSTSRRTASCWDGFCCEELEGESEAVNRLNCKLLLPRKLSWFLVKVACVENRGRREAEWSWTLGIMRRACRTTGDKAVSMAAAAATATVPDSRYGIQLQASINSSSISCSDTDMVWPNSSAV